jgi:hypothetical protein
MDAGCDKIEAVMPDLIRASIFKKEDGLPGQARQ